jgi:hypothetical protein
MMTAAAAQPPNHCRHHHHIFYVVCINHKAVHLKSSVPHSVLLGTIYFPNEHVFKHCRQHISICMGFGNVLFARMHFTVMAECVGHCAKEASCLSHQVVDSLLKSASVTFMSPVCRINWSLFFLRAHMLGESVLVYINNWPASFYPQLLQASWTIVMISFISLCSDVLFQNHSETPKPHHQL